MPELDLEPGDYRERKPRGWRWRLPWSHPDDAKMQFGMLLACAGALAFVFLTRADGSRETLFGVTAVFAFVAGIMFTLVFRD